MLQTHASNDHATRNPRQGTGRHLRRIVRLGAVVAVGLVASVAPTASAAPGDLADLSVTTTQSANPASTGTFQEPNPVVIGGIVTYTSTITNHGPQAASDVRFVDTLGDKQYTPAFQVVNGSRILQATPSSGSCSVDTLGRTTTCSLGSLASGAQATVAVDVFAQVNQFVVIQPAETVIVNTATVASAGGEVDSTPADNAATQTSTLVPGISVDDPTVTQPTSGSTTFAFTVYLSPGAGGAAGGGSARTVTVHYATSDGTATTANGDYNATSGDLTFNPLETSKTVSVTVNGESPVESPGETMHLDLSNNTNAVIVRSQGTATLNP